MEEYLMRIKKHKERFICFSSLFKRLDIDMEGFWEALEREKFEDAANTIVILLKYLSGFKTDHVLHVDYSTRLNRLIGRSGESGPHSPYDFTEFDGWDLFLNDLPALIGKKRSHHTPGIDKTQKSSPLTDSTLNDAATQEQVDNETKTNKYKNDTNFFGVLRKGKLLLNQKFKVVGCCGEGGKATVYKVEDLHRNGLKYKAIKLLKGVHRTEALKDHEKELGIAESIQHKNIAKYFDTFNEGKFFFLLMEYIDGKTLENRMKDFTGNIIPEKIAVEYLIQVAEGIRYIDKSKIRHRDIKPANIMINSEGIVKIVDFSISETTEQLRRPEEKYILAGTLPYMAPELLGASHYKYDIQTEIWSLGVTAYVIVSGDYPFLTPEDTRKPRLKAPPLSKVSSRFNRFLEKCLEKDREKRYKNMDEVLHDLKEIQDVFGQGDNRSTPDTIIMHQSGEFDTMEGESGSNNSPLLRVEARNGLVVSQLIQAIKAKCLYDSHLNSTIHPKKTQGPELEIRKKVIVDRRFRLIWHVSGSQKKNHYKSAVEWVAGLNNERYDNAADWRIPTLEEAMSLLQPKNYNGSLFINPAFDTTLTRIYTCDTDGEGKYWCVDFVEGNAFLCPFEYAYVKPVRTFFWN